MAPYSAPYLESCDSSSSMRVASNWDPCMLRDIRNGCPCPSPSSVAPLRSQFPLIRSSACAAPATDIYATPQRESCKLPPIYNPCGNHPRDDCCRIPSCIPSCNTSRCPPDCTPAICVERTLPVKPENRYEPPSQPFEGCSLYRTNYSGCYGPPAVSVKPPTSFDYSTARMADTSLYREHYTCKPICPVERKTNKEEYSPSCSPFEGCSTYRVDFRGCYGRPADLVKPSATYDPSSGRMDGTTIYRNDFIPYCPAEYQYARGIYQKPEETSLMSCSPFSECSTYRVDFPPKCAIKQPSMKPANRYGFSNAPFCNRTTYKNDYNPFYFKECCPDNCIRRCR